MTRFCVANKPDAVPVTSAHARSNATPHYGLQLARHGPEGVGQPHRRDGLKVHKRKIAYRAVAKELGYELVEPKAVLTA
ncbi:hypothetical protein [Mesorhizobium jarvisii]|uniref:Truncated alanine dehydrogenase n=1 Tax=Rhizobium loti TaxID=381 RepID=M5ALQ4_RHILI|nr:truncated alanine dehydrogenase [Mesorhizobium loti NZP2037]